MKTNDRFSLDDERYAVVLSLAALQRMVASRKSSACTFHDRARKCEFDQRLSLGRVAGV